MKITCLLLSASFSFSFVIGDCGSPLPVRQRPDVSMFVSCLCGPASNWEHVFLNRTGNRLYPGPESAGGIICLCPVDMRCEKLDADGDGDVDLIDFAAFQRRNGR